MSVALFWQIDQLSDAFGRANCQKWGGGRKVNTLYDRVSILHSRCVRSTVLSASLPIFSLLCRLADAVGVERCQETSNIWWQSNRQEEEQVRSQKKKKKTESSQISNDLACALSGRGFSCLRSSLQTNQQTFPPVFQIFYSAFFFYDCSSYVQQL